MSAQLRIHINTATPITTAAGIYGILGLVVLTVPLPHTPKKLSVCAALLDRALSRWLKTPRQRRYSLHDRGSWGNLNHYCASHYQSNGRTNTSPTTHQVLAR